jgi:predicted GIY-YIG superfamily endonuclease
VIESDSSSQALKLEIAIKKLSKQHKKKLIYKPENILFLASEVGDFKTVSFE